jgi:hypothetical protein
MYTRVKKDQFEIRDGVYIHRPTEAEFAPSRDSLLAFLVDSFVLMALRGFLPLPGERDGGRVRTIQ